MQLPVGGVSCDSPRPHGAVPGLNPKGQTEMAASKSNAYSKVFREVDAKAALAEHEQEKRAALKKTAKLRELRLAKEAEERANEFFVIPDAEKHFPARFMLYVAPVREEKRADDGSGGHAVKNHGEALSGDVAVPDISQRITGHEVRIIAP